jgi:Ca-activated chloride channel family protein
MKFQNLASKTALLLFLGSATVCSLTQAEERGPLASSAAGVEGGQGGHGLVVAVGDPSRPRWTFVEQGTLRVEGRLGHAALSDARGGETYVYLDVEAARSVRPIEAPPLALSLVIDRSGSMAGKRIANALAAARGMVERLREGDLVSLVAYDNTAHLVLPATLVTRENRAELARKLDGIHAQGETCISCGLDVAVGQLAGRDAMVKRLVLLSDGEPTVGAKEPRQFQALAERARDAGVSIRAVGVDVDYNERVMSAIARGSNGRHTFVDNPGELYRIFEDEERALRETVAMGAELSVELAPGVELLEVFDRAFERVGSNLRVPLGTFGMGEQKTVLVKVRVPEGLQGEQAVAEVRVNYRDLVKVSDERRHGALSLLLGSGEASPLDPVVAARLQRSQTADTLLELNRKMNEGDAQGALRLIERKRAELTAGSAYASQSAPAEKKAALAKDFEAQRVALEEAASAFSSAPSEGFAVGAGRAAGPAAAPPASRSGKASVRRNAEAADAFAY